MRANNRVFNKAWENQYCENILAMQFLRNNNLFPLVFFICFEEIHDLEWSISTYSIALIRVLHAVEPTQRPTDANECIG